MSLGTQVHLIGRRGSFGCGRDGRETHSALRDGRVCMSVNACVCVPMCMQPMPVHPIPMPMCTCEIGTEHTHMYMHMTHLCDRH